MFGFLNINKPVGITSHDVVSVLRRITKIKQIGHTGTLDPMAQGVLPVAIGKASRLIEYLEENKGYIAELELGKISDTYDSEGIVEVVSNKKIQEKEFLEAINNFKGEITQTPPAFSALHYNGKRLYELLGKVLTPREQKVLIMRYGLYNGREYTQREIAGELGISRSYISRIEKNALMKLRQYF